MRAQPVLRTMFQVAALPAMHSGVFPFPGTEPSALALTGSTLVYLNFGPSSALGAQRVECF